MRSLMLACAALAGCAATPDVQPEHRSDKICQPRRADGYIGQMASQAVGSQILAASHSEALRWAPPNTYLTEDWHPWRVTVHYDANGRVTRIECG